MPTNTKQIDISTNGKYKKEEPRFEVLYKHFTTYLTSDVTDIESAPDGCIHLYWEDYIGHKWFIEDRNNRKCVFHVNGTGKLPTKCINISALVFKTNGDIEFSGTGDARLCNLTFDNEGDVLITYSKNPTKSGKSVVRGDRKKGNTGMCFSFHGTKFIANNRGDFKIMEHGDQYVNRIMFNDSCRFDIRNKGKVSINTTHPFYNGKFYNNGDISMFPSSIHKTEFHNDGTVYLNTSRLSVCSFANSGNLRIDFSGRSKFSGNSKFTNKGDVQINGEMPTFSETAKDVLFNNYGSVIFSTIDFYKKRGLDAFNKESHVTFTKRVTSVRFSGLIYISCGRMVFNNRGQVIASSVIAMNGSFVFRNKGSVYFRSLVSDTPLFKTLNRILQFENAGDVHLDSFDNVRLKDHNFPIISNKGKCYFRSNDDYIVDRRRNRSKNADFPIISKDGAEYSNASYLKRYNVKITNGVATLYKGISRVRHTAIYDKIDTTWKVGEYIEHPNWDPYTNEIGEGKYIAGFAPDIFNRFFPRKEYDVVEIEVKLYDLYEWPSIGAKYPQFIGVRAAKVVKKL